MTAAEFVYLRAITIASFWSVVPSTATATRATRSIEIRCSSPTFLLVVFTVSFACTSCFISLSAAQSSLLETLSLSAQVPFLMNFPRRTSAIVIIAKKMLVSVCLHNPRKMDGVSEGKAFTHDAVEAADSLQSLRWIRYFDVRTWWILMKSNTPTRQLTALKWEYKHRWRRQL